MKEGGGGGRERGGREGEREGGRERERERGRGEREGERKGGREGGREGERRRKLRSWRRESTTHPNMFHSNYMYVHNHTINITRFTPKHVYLSDGILH